MPNTDDVRRATTTSSVVLGVEGALVDVHVDISPGLPGFVVAGIPEAAARETRVRVQAAIVNAGFDYPAGRVAVSIGPTPARSSVGLDLPIAVAIVSAQQGVSEVCLSSTTLLGELALSGDVRPVRGALAAAEAALKAGKRRIIVAVENVAEASVIEGLDVIGVRNLREALRSTIDPVPSTVQHRERRPCRTAQYDGIDLRDVPASSPGRRALEIAAAGGHHVLFVAPLGAGAAMLARRLTTVLPGLTHDEAIEVTRIRSAAGLNVGAGLASERPFRAPHYSTSTAGLLGGGTGDPRPGEISLAHHGVLFLDELGEFSRASVESVPGVLRDGRVLLARASGSVSFPAAPIVVAAVLPCPCGRRGDGTSACSCSDESVTWYSQRLAAVRAAFDLTVPLPRIDVGTIDGEGEASDVVRVRVERAKAFRAQRAEIARGDERTAGARVMRIARTIADLAQSPVVIDAHVAEANELATM